MSKPARGWVASLMAIPLMAILILAACGSPAKAPSVSTAPKTASQQPASQQPSVTARPPVADATLTTVGPTQTVFDWSKDRCDDNDIPDLPARAFRDAKGNVQVIATHYINRRFIGSRLDTIKRACQVVMRSPQNADPSLFADHEWLASPYTVDGKTIYALVHDEYHGHEHPGRCPQGEYFPCWYNSITLAISTDAGASYRLSGTPPNQLVATLPHRYQAGAGPSGIFEPSNIIRARDGLLYAFVRIDEYQSDSQRICLMRTGDIADPRSWRGWDGQGFSIRFTDPYTRASTPSQECAAVDPFDLGMIGSSVTFNTYLNRYVAVGTTTVHVNGRDVWGIGYSFSDDLVSWSARKLLFAAELPWTYHPGDANVYLYPSLIDPDSASRTFDTSGRAAYLYLTRFNTKNGGMTLDRDLVRIPVEFFTSADQASSASVPFRP